MNSFLNPRIAGVRLSMLMHLYRLRLRSHAVQELLAASGIAVGVALVLGVLVANTSLTGAAGELTRQVVGSARLQLTARSPEGFDEALAAKSMNLRGVQAAAPVLRENITIVGPRARRAVQLLGVTGAVASLGGIGTRDFGPGGFRFAGGLVLPAEIASAIGVRQGQQVTVLTRGFARSIGVGAIVGSAQFGAVASSPVAITLLPVAQRLTGLDDRVTQVFLRPAPGAGALVARELRALAGPRLDVQSAEHELRLLEQAAEPNDESTSLFAAISVVVGFLLAMNAMLLTVPERRRYVADLRMQGYDWRQIVVLLGFQALLLGLVASAAGVGLGVVISHAFLHRIPAYLVAAFPIGTEEILHVQTVLLAIGAGVLATILASLAPIFDLRPSRPADAILHDRASGGEVLTRTTVLRLTLASALATGLVTLLVLVDSGLTIVGGVALALTTLFAIPSAFVAVAHVLRWTGERVRSSALIVVVSELRTVTTRAVALAGVAGLAVYGSVAIGGARADLVRGLDNNFREYLGTADVWVTTGGNDLTTNSFEPAGAIGRIALLPEVSSVRSYQGGFLDYGPRRLWIIARPAADPRAIPASQLLSGDLATAERHLDEGGWATVSGAFARERRLHVGSRFTLPTPSGQAGFAVAAITTNLGWTPGAIILNSNDFRADWQTANPTALEVSLRPGVSGPAGRRAVAGAIAAQPGLRAQDLAAREHQYATDSRQGLHALSEISTLLLIAAALAVASALSAAIWQRRARLASLKIQGYGTGQLWRALLLESAIVLGVGCVIGAAAGVYGHALASRWLRLETGFPAPFAAGLGGVFLTLALLAVSAIAVITLPGLAAARAPAKASLQE